RAIATLPAPLDSLRSLRAPFDIECGVSNARTLRVAVQWRREWESSNPISLFADFIRWSPTLSLNNGVTANRAAALRHANGPRAAARPRDIARETAAKRTVLCHLHLEAAATGPAGAAF